MIGVTLKEEQLTLGRRVFLGGVTVTGNLDVPLVTSLPFGKTLKEAAVALGAKIGQISVGTPTIAIGGPVCPSGAPFHIRTEFSGWRGGIVPADSDIVPAPSPVMALSPMLSAALAINEAYLHISGTMPVAGKRVIGMSLWNPSAEYDWLESSVDEPKIQILPSHLWLIGLGHLGQAYLWALALLPFPKASSLSLVLQDIEEITPSNESTSILSDSTLIGQKKTRAMAAWAERRGFKTSIQERLFDALFKRQTQEPPIALCGLDNALGRQALDQVGFDFVVEAGLGRGHFDFRSIRLHTLPATRTAAEIWNPKAQTLEAEPAQAYSDMFKKGEIDRCGMTLLAGKAVGAPFVGAVAASLAIAETLRLLHRGPIFELIDINLISPEYRLVVPARHNFSRLNPGYIKCSN